MAGAPAWKRRVRSKQLTVPMPAKEERINTSERDRLARAPRVGPTATGWPLSSALPPFPVETPYLVRPDLTKLGADPLLREDSGWQDWIQEKETLQAAGQLVLTDPRIGDLTLTELTMALCTAFQGQAPNGPIDADGGFPWLGGVHMDHPRFFLEALSLSIQEDFALMVDLDGTGLSAAVLSVCFPSGWDPREKLGHSMLTLHEPVADNQRLQSAVGAMSAAICTKGPFVRYVWTLTGDSARARRPGVDSTLNLSCADQLWFRCERQVTVPLMGKASLFLIRVLIAPLPEVINSEERLHRLSSALQSMSPQMLAYKNLTRARELVLAMKQATR